MYGVEPVFIREGGSIPVTAAFTSQLGLPVVLLGFAQPACNAHAPNEWLALDNFERGTRVIVRLWDELADRAGGRAGGAPEGVAQRSRTADRRRRGGRCRTRCRTCRAGTIGSLARESRC